jgi:tetratricopeptide (TPR) repeat protein
MTDIPPGEKASSTANGDVNGRRVDSSDDEGREFHLPAPPFVPPLQIPAPPLHFRARRGELEHLLAGLRPGATYTLLGPGGAGKTALAAHAVNRLTGGITPPSAFPDGVIFHSFYKRPGLDLALDHIAHSCGEEVRPTPLEAARRALANRSTLLVLDGAEEAEDLEAVLAIRGRCGVLITSRNPEHLLENGQSLFPLESADGAALLVDWAKSYAQDSIACGKVWELTGGLPLALRLAGQYLHASQTTVQDFVTSLENSPLARIADSDERRHTSLAVLLDYTLARLSDEAHAVLAVASRLAFAPFDRAPIGAALERVHDRELMTALNELAAYGLLDRRDTRYHLTHRLLYQYIRQRLAPPAEAVENLVKYYAHLAGEKVLLGAQDPQTLDMALPHILFLLQRLEASKSWPSLLALAVAVDPYLALQGYTTERLLVCRRALVASGALGDRRSEGAWLGKRGLTYWGTGQIQQATDDYQQALEIARLTADRRNEGAWLGDLGNVYAAQGESRIANDYYLKALEIARQTGDRRMEGNTLGNLGLLYAAQGKVRTAIQYYQQAVEIAREIGLRQMEGTWLGNLGLAYAALGNMQEALECYQQAAEIARQTGDIRMQGTWLGNLGNACTSLGRTRIAIDYYLQALQVSRQAGDHDMEVDTLNNLGLAYVDLGETRNAIDCYQKALEVSRQTGDRVNERTQLGNLGFAWYTLGELQKARELTQSALKLSQQAADRFAQACCLDTLGLIQRDLGRIEQARASFQQALTLFVVLGSPNAEETRANLAALPPGGQSHAE